MINADKTGPLAPALWGLSEAVNRSTGLAHSTEDSTDYFVEAGFHDVQIHEFIPQTLERITGRKPG